MAFRSVTQIGIGWFKDALLVLLFSVLGVLLLVDAGRAVYARKAREDSPAD